MKKSRNGKKRKRENMEIKIFLPVFLRNEGFDVAILFFCRGS